MRAVVATEPGVLELNWMWLPTWVGMSATIKKELEKEIGDFVVGRPMNDETLDEVNDMVIDFIEARAPGVSGIRDYLDGLKFVSLDAG